MKILLEGIVGSTAYGLATATSDVDKLGVMQLPAEHFLGLESPRESSLSQVTTEPDVTYHDVGKFCKLVLGCNPTAMELLWLPEELYTQRTYVGQELIWMREDFLSAQRVKDAYMGYALSQATKAKGKDHDGTRPWHRQEKNARHLLRLMYQGYTLYTTGELPIHLSDPERFHEFGRRAVKDLDYMQAVFETYRDKFESAKSVLPKKPKTKEIEEWVLDLRTRSL